MTGLVRCYLAAALILLWAAALSVGLESPIVAAVVLYAVIALVVVDVERSIPRRHR